MKNISSERKKLLRELERKIDYEFKKKYLLDRALTHSSYANEEGLPYIEHNERMEFLGDSVLSIIISEHIFNKYKSKPEGKLSRIRAGIVCEESLYECAVKLELGKYMKMGKGEEYAGGRTRVSTLADAFEALIAALYIDGGMETAKSFVISCLKNRIEDTVKDVYSKDYKTKLQELVQREPGSNIRYSIIKEEGPDHDKTFFAEVIVNNNITGKGHGKSKKEAEQEAAKSALSLIGDEK